MNEQFKEWLERMTYPIKGLDGMYLLFPDGGVWSIKRQRMLKPFKKNGYLAIRIQHKNERHNFYIHRLLAEYYLRGTYFEGAEVNHKDCDKLNNDLCNLEWVTRSQNTQHAYDNNLIDTSNRGGYRHGKRNV